MKRAIVTVIAVVASGAAIAQISPSAPPQNAPFNDTAPAGRPAPTEAEARKLLAAQGYSQIDTITADSTGGWNAKARAGGQEVMVKVGRDGQVTRAP